MTLKLKFMKTLHSFYHKLQIIGYCCQLLPMFANSINHRGKKRIYERRRHVYTIVEEIPSRY